MPGTKLQDNFLFMGSEHGHTVRTFNRQVPFGDFIQLGRGHMDRRRLMGREICASPCPAGASLQESRRDVGST